MEGWSVKSVLAHRSFLRGGQVWGVMWAMRSVVLFRRGAGLHQRSLGVEKMSAPGDFLNRTPVAVEKACMTTPFNRAGVRRRRHAGVRMRDERPGDRIPQRHLRRDIYGRRHRRRRRRRRVRLGGGCLHPWAAVQEADSNPDLNLISLEAPAPATYEVTLTGAGEELGRYGRPRRQAGPRRLGSRRGRSVIDAGGFDRAFHVQGAGTSFELGDAAVIGGNAGTGDGGAILSAGTTLVHDALLKDNASRNGGGIASVGTLTVEHSRLESNRSTTQAGAIAIGSPATAQPSALLFSLQDSDVRSNFAESVGGGIVVALRPRIDRDHSQLGHR